MARTEFRTIPLVVAIDEAHQFFDVTVGDEFANTRLNAFDAIAKEGRKYGLTVCVADGGGLPRAGERSHDAPTARPASDGPRYEIWRPSS
ncbi:hypothetical protein [Nocardioides sp.]|uniref:hypothetical protein n=1 Tax=Nocardioides sp. TaxID=35761 RepID=UPI0039E579F4